MPLGKIDDFMIHLDSGKTASAVLSFGGVLGIGNKLFAVPWPALSLDRDRRELILNVDKERLKNAPGFDKDSWPDMANTEWGENIHKFYGHISELSRELMPSFNYLLYINITWFRPDQSVANPPTL